MSRREISTASAPAARAHLRGRLQAMLHRAWLRRGLTACLLFPLGLLHRLVRGLREWAYAHGWKKQAAVGVPVIVVGNLYVGGVGKTPVVMALVRELAARGWRPGVVSRGYGAADPQAGKTPRRVTPGGQPGEFGDEPVLIAQQTGVPVAVGRDRSAAALLLVQAGCTVIVADDGLQHLPLARSFEVAVLHGAGLGNRWLLPAGPLRDPPQRLARVDAVVSNGPLPRARIHSPLFFLHSRLLEARSLGKPDIRLDLAELGRLQRAHGLQIAAVCGIGTPERFFSMLASAGLQCEGIALPDHETYLDDPFSGLPHDRILITEKDAVKCASDARFSGDERIWVVPLQASLDPALADLIEGKIGRPPGRSGEPEVKSTKEGE